MKFKVEIEETVTYRHTVTVEAEHESNVYRALDEIEESAENRDDIRILCEDKGVKVIDFCEDGSPEVEFDNSDFKEVSDYEEEEDD